jgi:hypothetical protein
MILPARRDGRDVQQRWAQVVLDQEVGEEFIREYPGRTVRVNPAGYAYADLKIEGKLVKVYLHRWIMRAPKGLDVDHINGDRLDNRRENLQLCTRGQNMMKSRKRRGTRSRYRGVSWNAGKQRWQAQVNIDGRAKLIGRFESEEEAARAYDATAKALYGAFFKPNFPDES